MKLQIEKIDQHAFVNFINRLKLIDSFIYFKIKDNHNNDIIVVQIAGLVARRIVCESNKNQELNQGDRIGMIRFGSRADVYYENYEPLVKIGQTAIAGETLLAKK